MAKKKVQKVIKDGKVAILVSPGYGAGWSTWFSNSVEERAVFCPALVNAVLAKVTGDNLEKIAKKEFPSAFLGGVKQLKVEWLPEGTLFVIHEYDGHESVQTPDILCYTA